MIISLDPAEFAADALDMRRACLMCLHMGPGRACLEHTCPDCGQVSYLSVEAHSAVCHG